MANAGFEFAQDPVHCNSCHNYAEYKCRECSIHICVKCRLKHKGTGHHLNHKISLIDDMCREHATEQYQLYCEKCETPVCTKCMVEKHKCHPFCDIKTMYQQQKAKLSEHLKKLKYTRIPQYTNCLDKIKGNIQKHHEAMKSIRQEMAEQNRNIINEINKTYIESLEELTVIENRNLTYLQEEEENMKNCVSKIEESVKTHQESMDVLDEVSLLLYAKEDVHYNWNCTPTVEEIALPTYDRGKLDDLKSSLLPYFGKLTVKYNPKKLLMDKLQCTNSFSLQFPIKSVCCSEPSRAWFSTFNPKSSSQLGKLLANDGKKQNEIKFTRNVYDMAVSNLGRVLYSDREGKRIMEITNSRKQVAFITMDRHPQGICFLRNGELMVCVMASQKERAKLTRYDTEGQVVKEHLQEDAQYLFSDPIFITEDSNEKCWISDKEKMEVLVMDKQGKLMFTYCDRRQKRFQPDRIKADKLGNVFLAESAGSKIHIIDENGELIRYLNFGSAQTSFYTNVFDVDGMGKIWLAHADLVAEEFDVHGDTSVYELKYLR